MSLLVVYLNIIVHRESMTDNLTHWAAVYRYLSLVLSPLFYVSSLCYTSWDWRKSLFVLLEDLLLFIIRLGIYSISFSLLPVSRETRHPSMRTLNLTNYDRLKGTSVNCIYLAPLLGASFTFKTDLLFSYPSCQPVTTSLPVKLSFELLGVLIYLTCVGGGVVTDAESF